MENPAETEDPHRSPTRINLKPNWTGTPRTSRPKVPWRLSAEITIKGKMAIQLKKRNLQKKKWKSSKKRNPLMLHFRIYPTLTSVLKKNTAGNDAQEAIPRTNIQNIIGINKNSWTEEHHQEEAHHPEALRPGAHATTTEEWIPSSKTTEVKNTTRPTTNTTQEMH